jgi:hypothetical protein
MHFGGSFRRVEARLRGIALPYEILLAIAYPLDELSFLLKKVACIFNIRPGSKTP